jgi:hypothetical protein
MGAIRNPIDGRTPRSVVPIAFSLSHRFRMRTRPCLPIGRDGHRRCSRLACLVEEPSTVYRAWWLGFRGRSHQSVLGGDFAVCRVRSRIMPMLRARTKEACRLRSGSRTAAATRTDRHDMHRRVPACIAVRVQEQARRFTSHKTLRPLWFAPPAFLYTRPASTPPHNCR